MARARRPRSATKSLGEDRRKIHPKLRMVANGSAAVNAVRASQAAYLTVDSAALLRDIPVEPHLALAEAPRRPTKPKLKAIPDQISASVFVQTSRAVTRDDLPGEVTAGSGRLFSLKIPLASLRRLARAPAVTLVEPADTLAPPRPVITAGSARAPSVSRRRFGSAARHREGEGVLMGIVDVQGFDFAHADFLDDQGRTRFVRIWDQGGAGRPNPAGFGYGAEIRTEHMHAAQQASAARGLPATELEPQSQMAEASHGTHVASIAAGRRGVCRKAAIAAVLVSLPEEDFDRRRSFYDSSRIVHAVQYLVALGEELGMPVSINISLGTNGHAHDGSSVGSRWIDSLLSVPGRAVTVAAGNAGQEGPEFSGDDGYVMGRIHTSGQLLSRGLTADIEWVVAGNGVEDVSENELELWYGPQDRFAISICPPGGEWIGPIRPLEYLENLQLPGGSFLSVYNELYYPSNGSNYISVYLSPYFSPEGVIGVLPGTWKVRLHGEEVRDGRFHAWLERDDPRPAGRQGERALWSFPSFFSERSNVDDSSISSLACGQNIIAVANLDEARERIAASSSEGPTRDGRPKPDCAAPGTDVVAANGFADQEWVAMSGTSMASPHVAGLVGLMLAVEPRLTASQVRGIIQRTARPLPGASYQWQKGAGFGRLDEEACLEEAGRINDRRDRTPEHPGGPLR